MKKASEILGKILEQSTIESGASYSSLFRSWEHIAGPDIASHSRIVDVKNGIAVLEADHPAWLQIIQLKQTQMLKKIKRLYPELAIESIRMFLKTDSSGDTIVKAEKRDIVDETGDEVEAIKNTPEYSEFLSLLKRMKKK
jgi:hypothetical protein